MRRIFGIAVVVMLFLSGGLWADEKEDVLKAQRLYDQGKLEEALVLVEKGIKKYPGSQMWLKGKYFILLGLGRYHQALDVAIQKDRMAKEKTSDGSLDIARVYLKMKNKEEALKWLETTVNRGYIQFREFKEDPTYDLVRQDKRFAAIIQGAKRNIGLGKPAKEFTVQSLDGKELSLSQYAGKVVLVDFWATWCPPCVKEIPHLKKYYSEFKDSGFEIIGISLDISLDALKTYIEKEKLGWPIAYSGKGWDDKTGKLYSVTSIPSVWLVDKKGVLRYFNLNGEELRKAIVGLVAE